MKNSFKLFVTLFILAFAFSVNAQIPSYTLEAKNGVFAPDLTSATFDIVLTHTDATPYEYAGAQYFMAIPVAFGPIATGPATAGGGYQYELVGGAPVTDFPPPPATQFIPRNPSTVLATVNGVPSYELRLAANALPGAGSGFMMPTGVPFLIIRMKIVATAPGVLDPSFGNLMFRDSCTPGPLSLTRTKLNAYVGTLNQEITRCANHSVEANSTLPVELASFSASVNRNNVNLNWATSTELNNQGFDIERKLVSATDWSRVGNIAGNGTTSEQKNYTYSDRASTGNYNYRLKQIDLNGNFTYHPLANEVIVGVPSTYNLSQNYPNPFNPTTKVDYDLPYDGQVSIKLFDISGREVANLVNEVKTAGYYTLQFNASNLASGLYFYRITAQGNSNNFVQTKKMVLVK
ncbi:MAG: T9SS type A sorting domain-containing protein [Bacteroidota bacterium]|nr:T9SS type A sorting domain-containing protein [Bacteroidota bacterium]